MEQRRVNDSVPSSRITAELSVKRSSNGTLKTFSSSTAISDTYEFSFPSGLFDSTRRKRKKLGAENASSKHQRRRDKSLDARFKFTLMRMRKEEFRRRIVDLIISEPSVNNSDKDVARFYNYIQNGLDTLHVAPMESTTLNEIMSLISEHYKKSFVQFIRTLLKQVKEDYLWTIKKSIVDYALLQDEAEESIETPEVAQHLEEDFPPDYAKIFILRKRKIKENLILINPCMKLSWVHWGREFRNFRLVDLHKIKSHDESWDLMQFQSTIDKQIQDAVKYLRAHWFGGIQQIFLVNNRKNLVPSPVDKRQFDRFFNCIAKLMESQLLSIFKCSLKDFMSYVFDVRLSSNSYKLNVIVKLKEIQFDPPFQYFKDIIGSVLDSMREAMMAFERLETQLYLDWSGSRTFLKPKISESVIAGYKRQIAKLIEEQRVHPERSLLQLQKYDKFLNDEELERVKAFAADEGSSFERFQQLINLYRDLEGRVVLENDMFVFTTLFEINQKDFLTSVSKSVQSLKNILLNELVSQYQAKSKKVSEELAAIIERAESFPQNTAALMELIDYTKRAESSTLKKLESRLGEILESVTFLSDYWLLTEEEIVANNGLFALYHKVPRVLQSNRLIVENKTREFQDALRTRYQKFEDELEIYRKQVEEYEQLGDIEDIYRYQKKAQTLENRLIVAMEKIDKFNEEEAAFGWEITQYPLRKELAERLTPYKKLYDTACDFLTKHEKWNNATIGAYDPEDIENDVSLAFRTMFKLEKGFHEQEPRKLSETIRERIEVFKDRVPVIMALGNPGLKERHWQQISKLVGVSIPYDETLSLKKVLGMNLDEHIGRFEGISEAATKELTLEKTMQKMEKDWLDMCFAVNPYKDTRTYVVAAVDDVQLTLDDHIMKSMTMKNSPYIKPFEEQIVLWEKKLVLLQNILDMWLSVQGTWMYLEPIFSSPDIQQQMPEEGKKFAAVDKTWRDVMKTVEADPRVMRVIRIDKMLERLQKSHNLLDLIQKGLNDYLEMKRLVFPRFFFLSNDELLEILSETKDPTRVQPHLKKCFEGVARLTFDDELNVLEMRSAEGETVDLCDVISTVAARGQVERWLVQLEADMRKSVRHKVSLAIEAYPSEPRTDWVLQWPGQTVLCVGQLYWTLQIERAMIEQGLDGLRRYSGQTQQELNDTILLIRGKLSKQNRVTLVEESRMQNNEE